MRSPSKSFRSPTPKCWPTWSVAMQDLLCEIFSPSTRRLKLVSLRVVSFSFCSTGLWRDISTSASTQHRIQSAVVVCLPTSGHRRSKVGRFRVRVQEPIYRPQPAQFRSTSCESRNQSMLSSSHCWPFPRSHRARSEGYQSDFSLRASIKVFIGFYTQSRCWIYCGRASECRRFSWCN